jgi:hypothetical protein
MINGAGGMIFLLSPRSFCLRSLLARVGDNDAKRHLNHPGFP